MKKPDRTLLTKAHFIYISKAYIEFERVNGLRRTGGKKLFNQELLVSFLNLTFNLDKGLTYYREVWSDATTRYDKEKGKITWVEDLRGFILGDFSVRKV